MGFNPGGNGGIFGASDVALSNPVDDQSLTFNSTTQKWSNETLTKSQIGLSNVDNTADVNKPISTLQQNALDEKVTGDGITSVCKLTQAAYDAIPSKDPSTLYVIVG